MIITTHLFVTNALAYHCKTKMSSTCIVDIVQSMEEIKPNEDVENSDKKLSIPPIRWIKKITSKEEFENSDKINSPSFCWIRENLLNKPNIFLVVGMLELIFLIVGCALVVYFLSNL